MIYVLIPIAFIIFILFVLGYIGYNVKKEEKRLKDAFSPKRYHEAKRQWKKKNMNRKSTPRVPSNK